MNEITHIIAKDCLSVRLRLLNRLVGSIYDNALRSHGIKSTQFSVLVAVSSLGAPTTRELSRSLHMDTSTLSRAVSILKKNHWLRSEPSGQGKILIIRITSQGREKLEQAYPDWSKAQAAAVKALGEATADRIISTGTRYLSQGIKD